VKVLQRIAAALESIADTMVRDQLQHAKADLDAATALKQALDSIMLAHRTHVRDCMAWQASLTAEVRRLTELQDPDEKEQVH
jgi:hypothetical protein